MEQRPLIFHIVSLFPQIFSAMEWGVLGQAFKAEKIFVRHINPRDFTEDIHKSVDDRPYGGGDGMLMMAEPLRKSLAAVKVQEQGKSLVIHLSPQGKVWNQRLAKELQFKIQAEKLEPVLICGRYAGIDQRFINEYVDEEISAGDYVLSGGEFAALSLIDSLARLWPGVLGNNESAANDSFAAGALEAPQFTRPREFQGKGVPEALLSGNHKLIATWRIKMGLLRTLCLRPDLYFKQNNAIAGAGSTPTQPEYIDLINWAHQLSDAELKQCGLSKLMVAGAKTFLKEPCSYIEY